MIVETSVLRKKGKGRKVMKKGKVRKEVEDENEMGFLGSECLMKESLFQLNNKSWYIHQKVFCICYLLFYCRHIELIFDPCSR